MSKNSGYGSNPKSLEEQSAELAAAMAAGAPKPNPLNGAAANAARRNALFNPAMPASAGVPLLMQQAQKALNTGTGYVRELFGIGAPGGGGGGGGSMNTSGPNAFEGYHPFGQAGKNAEEQMKKMRNSQQAAAAAAAPVFGAAAAAGGVNPGVNPEMRAAAISGIPGFGMGERRGGRRRSRKASRKNRKSRSRKNRNRNRNRK